MTKSCQGTDISRQCRRCGTVGHFVNKCVASHKETLAFRRAIGAVANGIRAEQEL